MIPTRRSPASRAVRLLPAALWILLLGACDPSFDVFRESTLHFSVSGYLDAGRDTQWVRITALGGRSSSGLRVHLTETASGQSWPLRDSLFRYEGGATAHAYWTSARVRPGRTYALEIDDRAGRVSRTRVALPDSFPDPTFDPPPYAFPQKFDGLLVVPGVPHPAAVDLLYGFLVNGRMLEVPVNHLRDLVPGQGDLRGSIRWGEDLRQIAELGPDYVTLRSFRIRVTAASAGWPGPVELSYVDSPVENGVGYVGGLFTRTSIVPLGPARFPRASMPDG